jgi:hypothetical protein
MAKYVSETTRIDIKFIDAKTEETLFEVNDRNWMNMGEIFTTTYGDMLVQRELKGKKLPKEVLVISVKKLILE